MNAVGPVPAEMRCLSMSSVGLQGNKKALIYDLICILEQHVHSVPERACPAGKAKRTEGCVYLRQQCVCVCVYV